MPCRPAVSNFRGAAQKVRTTAGGGGGGEAAGLREAEDVSANDPRQARSA
jgi:hypothetical protein